MHTLNANNVELCSPGDFFYTHLMQVTQNCVYLVILYTHVTQVTHNFVYLVILCTHLTQVTQNCVYLVILFINLYCDTECAY